MDKNDVRAIENARQRYSQLVNTLTTFHKGLTHSEQLPPWPSQQAQFSVLSSNLESIAKTLSQNFPAVPPPQHNNAGHPHNRPAPAPSSSQPSLSQDTLIAYPNTSFPSRDNDTLIAMLFRKKPQPYVNEWMAEGRKLAQAPCGDGVPWLSPQDTFTLWNSAVDIVRELGEERDWDDAYTKEERDEGIETVETGLRTEMMEIGTLDEKGKKKTGTVAAATGVERVDGLKIEQFFRFWSTGTMPHNQQQAQELRR
ncbi:hypothetical protein BDZ91DRAFT_716368 [Kalaharituber pfeilii]|nr:hypothetical protein BDZ91DRAFT_716368 [Kalaharituber pfeilii]